MPSIQKEGTEKDSRESAALPAEPSKDPALKELPQELIDQIVDEITSTLDLKSSSLVGRAWTHRSQVKLFRRIVLTPHDVETWLSRTKETVTAMAPWIAEFELRGDTKNQWSAMPWDRPSVLTRLIRSLATSPIVHLTIVPFRMGRFQETSLARCFEPIAKSLCSLELRFVETCVPALTFLISMFPNLDDLLFERVSTTPMTWTRERHDPKYIPSFAGTFEYPDLCYDIGPELLSWMTGHPLRFRTISPGMLTRKEVLVFAELVTMCASTLREIPYVMFDDDVEPEHLGDFLNPCTNLRRVGTCGGFDEMCPIGEAMMLSSRSRHISVIYIEILDSLHTLQVDVVWVDQGWQRFEDFLCQLAEERVDDGVPLVLELGIFRDLQLASGPLHPGTILPRFRKRGLLRFVAVPPGDFV